ncbi:hypothetical protein FRACYDRAFT_240979 [Fragilariopsis cylindrus CCMP1102]|uniref:Uncharacterized protein n=1 Tax=Fragilariopsis cylindrus CCMP1102 TaxID=635003 RepID=A0A1E7F8E5_9STRA|nr:hypothetical protein FRACYDRAFT_240979 [Fragilariopsis cylindrus CCMP1102]|eukprot:OEU14437.1 hypothetical protein FRACYDRAFT_240979 [Fragilariopsis cylindrus CCMP1102]
MAWRRYKLAQAATKKMIMHAFKDYHFLELQDDNGDIVGYTAIELFDHLMDQYVQPEDVADQVTALHKILEHEYDPNEAPQVYYKAVQDARNALDSLNQTIDDETLIRHGLNQFKEHIDLKLDIRSWKLLTRAEKTWSRFKTHFTKAINDNKNDAGTLKAIGMANAVKHQIEQGKENQKLLAQATFEANARIEDLIKASLRELEIGWTKAILHLLAVVVVVVVAVVVVAAHIRGGGITMYTQVVGHLLLFIMGSTAKP